MIREQRIDLRVTAQEKRAWEKAARQTSLQLSQWIRMHLNQIARDALASQDSTERKR